MIDIKNVVIALSGSIVGFVIGYRVGKPFHVHGKELDDKVNRLIAAKMGLIDP
jgi:hypothetical protein